MFGIKSGEIQEMLTVLLVWKVSVALRCHEADNTLKKPLQKPFQKLLFGLSHLPYSAARNNKESKSQKPKERGDKEREGRERERVCGITLVALLCQCWAGKAQKSKEQRPFTTNELMSRSDDVWTCAPRSLRILSKVFQMYLKNCDNPEQTLVFCFSSQPVQQQLTSEVLAVMWSPPEDQLC